MTDDTDLTRLFAEAALPPDDDAFVARVTARIAWRKRLSVALPIGLAALLVLAIWATWPAAYDFSRDALSGLVLLAVWLGEFFTAPAGMFTAVVLLLTGVAWSWLFDRTRGSLI